MTLFLATLLTGILLLAFGTHFLWHGMRSAKIVQAFPRSQTLLTSFSDPQPFGSSLSHQLAR